MAKSFRWVAKWILRNTVTTNQSLTPEIRLRLITEASPLWRCRPELCPFEDPYWAFYWPGGQAVTRYILDNPSEFRDANVLDFGCGCGSASIAATRAGASVIANDVDTNALVSTAINYRNNNVSMSRTRFCSDNLLDRRQLPSIQNFLKAKMSFVILGDMFYDVDFTEALFSWLKRLGNSTTTRILAGDPDRHPLADQQLSRYTSRIDKHLIAQYPLPECVTREHYGFESVKVFELR